MTDSREIGGYTRSISTNCYEKGNSLNYANSGVFVITQPVRCAEAFETTTITDLNI